MFTFVRDAWTAAATGVAPTLFMAFFVYVWLLWTAKAIAARRYRPSQASTEGLRASVIVPVYDEPEEIWRRVLTSVVANRPAELIAVVDGGDAEVARIAGEYCDQVLRIPKAGKRAAIAAGLRVSDPSTQVVVVLDSDTIWAPDMLGELLRPFADPTVGGVTPRQAVFDPRANAVRRLADWIEDVRYHLTVPAQSTFGQVGCLAGRTIAYRRTAFEPAVERLVGQTVFGVPQHVGDDRVLTNELLRNGWRTVYQSTARVETDAPSEWPTLLAPAAALGPLEPARDAAEPALAVAQADGVRLLRGRHRHAVRALHGARARVRQRRQRRRRPGRAAARCSSSRSRTWGCWSASACARSRGCAGSRRTSCGCRCSCSRSRS